MKKFILLLLVLLFTSKVYASNVLKYDPTDPIVAGRVVWYRPSVNEPDYLIDPNDINTPLPNHIIQPDLSNVEGVIQKHWKVIAGEVVEWSQAEKDTVAQAEADALELSIRNGAKAQMDGFNSVPLYLRAFADVLKDEINLLRTEHGLTERTLQQLKTAVQNKISSGEVD